MLWLTFLQQVARIENDMADTQETQTKPASALVGGSTVVLPKTDYLVDDPNGAGVIHVRATSAADAANQVNAKEQKS